MNQKVTRIRQIVICTALLLNPLLLSAQTQSNLDAKYPVVHAYLVRPGFVMFAKFDGAGQVCELQVQKQPLSTVNKDAMIAFSGELADEIANELVPAAERGRPASDYLSPESYVAGGSFDLKRDFENVSIEKIGTASGKDDGIQELRILWTKRNCSGEYAAPIKRNQDPKPH